MLSAEHWILQVTFLFEPLSLLHKTDTKTPLLKWKKTRLSEGKGLTTGKHWAKFLFINLSFLF